MNRALPGSDVVVHVEPMAEAGELRERVRAAAMTVSLVRELHDVSLIETDDGIEASLHLKLPGQLPLDEAHAIAEEVERAIGRDAPEIRRRPDAPRAARRPGAGRDGSPHDPAEVERAVRAITGRPAARAAHALDERGSRRPRHARARPGRDGRRRARRGERGLAPDPRGAARSRRRGRAHRAVRLPDALVATWREEEAWLEALPDLAAACAETWGLELEEPVDTPRAARRAGRRRRPQAQRAEPLRRRPRGRRARHVGRARCGAAARPRRRPPGARRRAVPAGHDSRDPATRRACARRRAALAAPARRRPDGAVSPARERGRPLAHGGAEPLEKRALVRSSGRSSIVRSRSSHPSIGPRASS